MQRSTTVFLFHPFQSQPQRPPKVLVRRLLIVEVNVQLQKGNAHDDAAR